MAKRSLPRPKRGSHQPISYHPGKGLLVSTHARFPETVDDKIVCAKSIVQAVVGSDQFKMRRMPQAAQGGQKGSVAGQQ